VEAANLKVAVALVTGDQEIKVGYLVSRI
jgi:hypothetical protein